MIGYIYQIQCLQNGKSYIGQTVDYKRRKNTHIRKLNQNIHDNIKLQNAWNKYGEQEFHFRVWEFNINSLEELDKLECEYIKKFNSIEDGFNIAEGGGKPPLHQKAKEKDIITFLCILDVYGSGYGKSCEEIFGWSKGTASRIKRRLGYIEQLEKFDKMNKDEIKQIAENFYNTELLKVYDKRQLKQGGCIKAYSLTQDDYNFAFCAQELGYGYTCVAKYLGIKPTTVKDWFSGRSRKKEKEIYKKLTENEKNLLIGRLKIAELSGKPKSISSN